MDSSHSTTLRLNKPNALTFHGKSGEYFSIWLVNILLTVITLGIYSAWATVRHKRYFYGNLELNGDRFDYHARPVQILLGRLIVLAMIIVTYIAIVIYPKPGAVVLAIVALCLPWIIIRSWRFTARMSSYRGVSFNYACHIGRAYWVLLVFPVLALAALVTGLRFHSELTLNMAILVAGGPLSFSGFDKVGAVVTLTFIVGMIAMTGVASAMRDDLYVNNMYFGDRKFTATLSKKTFITRAFVATLIVVPFAVLILSLVLMSFASIFSIPGDAASLDRANTVVILIVDLLIITAILCTVSYLIVARRNHVFSQTTLCNGQITLHSSMQVGSYLWLVITNFLLVIFTLGLGSPAAHVRHARYMAAHTHIDGDLTLAFVNAHSDSAGAAVAA